MRLGFWCASWLSVHLIGLRAIGVSVCVVAKRAFDWSVCNWGFGVRCG